MPRTKIDPEATLCGRCGYPLDDVLSESACPECGRATELSLPHHRTGSAWQRSPSPMSWAVTCWQLVRSRDVFDRISIAKGSAAWLGRINIFLASAFVAIALTEREIDSLFSVRPDSIATVVGSLLLITPFAYLVIATMTRIESVGLRFFGNRRGGRLTPAISRAVTAHASYGWVLGGLLAAGGAFAGQVVMRPRWQDATSGWLISYVEPHLIIGALGFFLGLVAFETLSYLGAMRCRFANP